MEIYQGRQISFISEKTYRLLKEVKEKMFIVPITTRTVEQYERIHLGVGAFPYALTCNGGVLLVDGKKEKAWYQDSKNLILPCREELKKALLWLEKEERRYFECRFIEELFVFTKCKEAKQVVSTLRRYLDETKVDVLYNGEKVYVVPVPLRKGEAIKRLQEHPLFLKAVKKEDKVYTLAAGDSEFDLSMVQMADKGIVPYEFQKTYRVNGELLEMEKEKLFSEALLETCLNIKELFP